MNACIFRGARHLFASSLVAAALAACSFDGGSAPQAGSARDAGPVDAALPDGATSPSDAAQGDAPRPPDAAGPGADAAQGGPGGDGPDANVQAPDVGPDDAGSAPDSGASNPPPVGATCNGQPVDLSQDPRHCGQCGIACDAALGSCEAGRCTCAAGLTVCGTSQRCEDLTRDAANCGTCGNSCGEGAFCLQGACTCRPGLTLCAGKCVDLSKDPGHCGSCANSCGQGVCYSGNCQQGTCGWSRFDCRQGDGTACIPFDDPGGALHCEPSILNSCGTVCEGDQLCRKFGTFDIRRCRDMRPGRGCTACPCDDCTDREECEVNPDAIAGVFCVTP